MGNRYFDGSEKLYKLLFRHPCWPQLWHIFKCHPILHLKIDNIFNVFSKYFKFFYKIIALFYKFKSIKVKTSLKWISSGRNNHLLDVTWSPWITYKRKLLIYLNEMFIIIFYICFLPDTNVSFGHWALF